MLRLTFLLCASIFLAQLIAGRDFGQMRPGLTKAAVEAAAEALPVTAKAPEVETVVLEPKGAEPASAVTAVVVVAPVAPKPGLSIAVAETPVTVGDEAILTLATPAEAAPAEPEPAALSEGEIWYVAGNSLNVRSGPSTNDEVVGNLTRGEAALVVWREGEDWARIKIEGDGVEGYVAMRFLTAEAPAFN